MKPKIVPVDGVVIRLTLDGEYTLLYDRASGQRERVFFETLAEAARFVLDVEEGKV